MIASPPTPPAVIESAVTARFVPSIGATYRYRMTETRPMRDGLAVTTLDQTLSFARDARGIVATIVATGHAVEAPPHVRGALEALLLPFDGVAMRIRIDEDGTPGQPIDAATTWAKVQASVAALLARIAADPGFDPTTAATAPALAARFSNVDDASRDAQLREAAAGLLAPPLPALRVGEHRAFTAPIVTPAGSFTATGTLALADDATMLDYRIETRTDPASVAAATASLLATITPATSAIDRARIAAAAEGLRDVIYVERTRLSVERTTGLLLAIHRIRVAIGPDGGEREIDRSDIVRVD